MRVGIVDTALVVPVNTIALTDDVDFKTRETSIAYDAPGIELVWHFETAAGVITHTAVNPTSSGVHDWVNDGGAMYSVEIPASGGTVNNDEEGIGYFTGKADGVLPWRGPDVLIGSANAIGAMFGTDRKEVDAREWNGAAVATPSAAGYPAVTLKVGTGTGEVALAAGKAPATIAAGDIASGAITNTAIADNAISAGKIASEAITAAKLAENCITANAIASLAIGASQVAPGTIKGDTFVSGALTVGVRNAVGMSASNLDTQLAGILTAIGNLNNLSALANLFGPMVMEIPDADSTLYPFVLTIKDQEGKLVDLDEAPTITAANSAGTDRSANLSSVSHPSVGRYTFTYEVADDATAEGVVITAAGETSEEARTATFVASVVNFDTGAILEEIRQKTANLPESPAATDDIPTPEEIRQEMDTNSTKLASIVEDTNELQADWIDGGRLDLILDGRASQTSVDDIPTNEELGTALDGLTIPDTTEIADAVRVELGTELATLEKLESTLEADESDYRFTAAALAQAPTGSGGGGGDCPDATTIANAVAAKIITDHGEGSYVRNTEPDNTAAQSAATAAAAVKLVTDKLNTALELDGEVYRFTANALEAAPAGEAAAAVFWAYGNRTLTTPVASIIAAARGSRITATRFVALGISLTGLGNIEDRQKLFFTAKGKDYADETDDLAAIQIEETAGLLRIAGVAADDATAGALEVDNATTGDITIALTGESTAVLSELVGGKWDVKLITVAGEERQLTVGRFDVETAVTRATATAEE